jgi:phosphoribosylanthranilate isomerase
MRVKICGLKDELAIEAAARAGADYAGFVVDVAGSRRSLSLEEARALIRRVPEPMMPVAVIVPRTEQEAKAYARKLGCILQIHGLAAAPKTCTPVILALNAPEERPKPGNEFAVLVDSARPGSGIENDFSAAGRMREKLERPMFLAGGLDTNNVTLAIEKARPFAVDVSTGVETNGLKDHEKIREFVRRAKDAGRKIR